MKKLFFALSFFATLTVAGQSKPAYAIQFKVTGLKDTTAYLGYNYAESSYVRDTARVNGKGEFVFDGKQPLPQGVYFLVLDKSRIFDFVVGNNQHFLLETNTTDYIRNMVVKNDLDNKLFFENLVHNGNLRKEAEPFVKILQDSTLKDENKKDAREGYRKIGEKAMAYQDAIIEKNPTTVTARLLKTSKQIHIPDPPKKADGSIDSTFQLRYYRAHFFDNFDLSDDALIRLQEPLYSKKVAEYLDKLFVPQPDSVMKAIHFLVGKAKKNQETYKYMVFILTNKYTTPEYMGLDEVFVRLYDEYYAKGEMDFWANEKYKKNLKDHADNIRKSMVGRVAPNMIMQDSNFQPRSMYDIKTKYTILYFYDPDCGSCKKETPVLVDFYAKNKAKFNVEVYAVNSDTSMVKMRNYIKDMKMTWITVNGPRTYLGSYHDSYDANTTPTLYVLDDKKKIIGKKIQAAKLVDFLTNYEKVQKARADLARKNTP
ncbi:MAG TPA: thioredoxin-like domain-containing protein [Cyclobacteriaceae bacterium]|nr:thioredoxin-like domain-containing protein [Cyclobacteriaceae bacterium]